jgi:catechol 2,3-dioxygenase-like lactoylglutathione lyase family enzyme
LIRHVAGIAEIVDDLDAAIRFYRDSLGLEVKPTPDGNYADVVVDGVPHFGLWRRSHAALITYGDAAAAERVPLGFTVGFEVDSVGEGNQKLGGAGVRVVQGAHLEPWGQQTCRFLSSSGQLCEISETPWSRTLKASVRVSASG